MRCLNTSLAQQQCFMTRRLPLPTLTECWMVSTSLQMAMHADLWQSNASLLPTSVSLTSPLPATKCSLTKSTSYIGIPTDVAFLKTPAFNLQVPLETVLPPNNPMLSRKSGPSWVSHPVQSSLLMEVRPSHNLFRGSLTKSRQEPFAVVFWQKPRHSSRPLATPTSWHRWGKVPCLRTYQHLGVYTVGWRHSRRPGRQLRVLIAFCGLAITL